MNATEEERLKIRLKEFENAKTPHELSFVIWSKSMDEKIGSRKDYREHFIDWITSRKNKTTPKWNYKTPKDIAEAIYQPFLDEPNDKWFPALRQKLIEWLENYLQETKI